MARFKNIHRQSYNDLYLCTQTALRYYPNAPRPLPDPPRSLTKSRHLPLHHHLDLILETTPVFSRIKECSQRHTPRVVCSKGLDLGMLNAPLLRPRCDLRVCVWTASDDIRWTSTNVFGVLSRNRPKRHIPWVVGQIIERCCSRLLSAVPCSASLAT